MTRVFPSAHALLIVCIASISVQAAEPATLLGRIMKWQYPGAKMSGAQVSDAATVNADGERTVPSIHSKVVLTTSDPIQKVVAHYTEKLKAPRKSKDADAKAATESESGRSVTFHSDSDSRPVTIHMISINTAHTSTTLVISRAKTESETHIAWSQYERLPVAAQAR